MVLRSFGTGKSFKEWAALRVLFGDRWKHRPADTASNEKIIQRSDDVEH